MKKLLAILIAGIGLLCLIVIALFISADFQTLEIAEQQRLKEGKLFWEWPSSYGPLAMHYIEKGKGDQHILLLHGFRAHTYTWRHLIDPLAQEGYHVWAVDLIGYGFSDKPDQVPYHVDFFVQQIKAFMDAKEIARAHLVGNSMGGGLALNFACTHPDRTHSLSLLNALGYPLNLPLYLSIGRYFGKLWAPFLGPTVIRNGLKQIVFNQNCITEEQVEAYSLPYRFPGGAMASLLTLQQFDNQQLIEMGQRYTTLQHPLLVIWGDHDRLIPVSHYEKFLKDFPQAHKLLISKCGHIPQEEEPEQVIAAILEFLQHVEANPSK